MDAERRELDGGWVAITGGFVSAVGTGPAPPAARTIDATDCLVTPGLVNTHHHLFQNLTRAYPPMTDKPLFGWLQSLYPLWRRLDTEAAYLSAWVGLAELALCGCTTSTDHLYLHPRGCRRPARRRDRGGTRPRAALPPDPGFDVAVARRTAACRPTTSWPTTTTSSPPARRPSLRHHDRAAGAMTRIALAPCSPFTVTEDLMVALRRAGRAPRRAPAHPLRRERRGRRVLAWRRSAAGRRSTSSAPGG